MCEMVTNALKQVLWKDDFMRSGIMTNEDLQAQFGEALKRTKEAVEQLSPSDLNISALKVPRVMYFDLDASE